MLGITKMSRTPKTPNLPDPELNSRVRAAVESDGDYQVVLARLAGVRERLAGLRHELELHPRPWELTIDAIASAILDGEPEPDFSASRATFDLLARRVEAFETAERRLVDELARRRAAAARRGIAAIRPELMENLRRGIKFCDDLKSWFDGFNRLRGAVANEAGVSLPEMLGGGSPLFELDRVAAGYAPETGVRQVDIAKSDLARMLAEAVKKTENQ